MDQQHWPFRAFGVSHPTPEQDCCLGLNCETAFYRPARQKGFYKLAQHWLVAEALTTNFQRLYEELCCTRRPVWGHGRIAGLGMTWLSESRAFGQGRPWVLHPHHWVWLPKWSYKGVAIKYGERQSETMWKWKLIVTAMYKTKTHTCTEVSLCGGFFLYSV